MLCIESALVSSINCCLLHRTVRFAVLICCLQLTRDSTSHLPAKCDKNLRHWKRREFLSRAVKYFTENTETNWNHGPKSSQTSNQRLHAAKISWQECGTLGKGYNGKYFDKCFLIIAQLSILAKDFPRWSRTEASVKYSYRLPSDRCNLNSIQISISETRVNNEDAFTSGGDMSPSSKTILQTDHLLLGEKMVKNVNKARSCSAQSRQKWNHLCIWNLFPLWLK